MRFYFLFICVLTQLFFNCDKTNNSKGQQNAIYNDSLAKVNEKRKFDSIGAIADFITNSGGRLTTKETKAIYFADTNITGNLVNYAFTLIEEKNFKMAFYYLNKAFYKSKYYRADVYLYKGFAWNELNNSDSMYFYFDKAINEDSTNVKYLLYRAYAYSEDSLFQKAVDDMNRAINIEPNNIALYVNRGHYKIGLDDIKGAKIDMKDVPSTMKNNYMVYKDRAYIALMLGDYKEAIEQCNISISLNGIYGSTFTIRGIAKNKLGDMEGSYKDFKTAVALGDEEAVRFLQQYEEYFRTHKNI